MEADITVVVILERVCVNIISSLYQYLPISIIMAALFMVAYKEISTKGIKRVIHEWISAFRESADLLKLFMLSVYTCLILFRTVFCRQIWGNPIGDILGNWSFHFSDGSLSTELIENILLFIPFSFFAVWTFQDKILHGQLAFRNICWRTTKISFVFSICIEICQIVFRVGTFQISDLVMNTFGGVLGGVCYWIFYKVKRK